MNKFNDSKHSMKLMWGCVVFAVVAIALVAGGIGAGALFLVPCMLMMGAMMWMMMGGMGRTVTATGMACSQLSRAPQPARRGRARPPRSQRQPRRSHAW